jgi:PAS domain S-box-containing protein
VGTLDPDGAARTVDAADRYAHDATWFARGTVEPATTALSRAGVGVVVVDSDLRFVFVNDVAAEINGRPASAHVGRAFTDVLGATGSELEPMLRTILSTAEPVVGFEVVGETYAAPGVVRTWVGDYEPFWRTGTVGQPPDGVLIVFHEVTAERRAERRLRQLIDGLFTFVGLCDVDGTLVEVNEYAVAAAGLGVADVVGRPFWDCFWWSYDPGVQALVRDAVERAAHGETSRFDVDVRVAGGRLIPIDFQLVPVIERGQVVSLVPSGLDIEARSRQLQRLAELSQLSADLHVALTMRELVDLVVGRASGILDTSFVTFGVVDVATGSILVTSPAELDPDISERWHELTGDGPRTPFQTVVETGESVWVRTRKDRHERYPDMADALDRAGLHTTAALPLLDDIGVIGVLGLGWHREVLDDPTLELQADLFANMCAQALHRVNRTKFASQLLVNLTEQLMARRDTARQLDVATRYLPAVSEIGFGGDWYDVVTLSDTVTALIVGDVVGHDVDAAARMAVVRSSLRTAVLARPALLGIGELLSRSLGLQGPEFFATALVVIVDTETSTLRWKSYGHVPPVVCHADGSCTVLEGTGPPIGLFSDAAPIGTHRWTDASWLVLYTDGLVETPHDAIDDRIALLGATVATAPPGASADERLELAMSVMLDADPHDDVAVVVARLPAKR